MAKILLAADRIDRAGRTGIDRYTAELLHGLPHAAARHAYSLLVLAGQAMSANGMVSGLPVSHLASSRLLAYARLLVDKGFGSASGKVETDLVHFMSAYPFVPQAPTVVTIHDLSPLITPEAYSWYSRWIFCWTLRRLALARVQFIVNSNRTGQDLHERFAVPRDDIHCVYLGIDNHFRVIQDPERINRVRQKYRLPRRYLLYIGAMNRRKNLGVLLKAYRSLLDQRQQDTRLVLAGRMDWGGEELVAMIHALHLEEAVCLPGYISEDDLPVLIGQALALVYPSKYEGFGLPPLEAMACGTPVVASNAGAIPETAGDGAILVDPKDIPGFTAAFETVIHDQDRRCDLVEKGLRRAAAFTWEKTIQGTLAVYDSILGEA
jgi:glycosyltransferase involved in cell wall biosynthesis